MKEPMTADDCYEDDYSDFDAKAGANTFIDKCLNAAKFAFVVGLLAVPYFSWHCVKLCNRQAHICVDGAKAASEYLDSCMAVHTLMDKHLDAAKGAARFTTFVFRSANGNCVTQRVECASGVFFVNASTNGQWHLSAEVQ